jgi:hypothetical protein
MEGSTWYDLHGLPNPDRPDQIVAYREKQEIERKKKREEDFWAEVGKRVKFTAEVTECTEDQLHALTDATEFPAQCIASAADIKLNFR